jgi:hypothetical protein
VTSSCGYRVAEVACPLTVSLPVRFGKAVTDRLTVDSLVADVYYCWQPAALLHRRDLIIFPESLFP